MQIKLELSTHINPDQAGTYFTLPFNMPPDTETLDLVYSYPRHAEDDSPLENGVYTSRPEINIIDLGLVAPDGTPVGASGSDKAAITLSETFATPGYRAQVLTPGEWKILVGAYKIAPEGVTVSYGLTYTPKTRRLLKGDLHVHTLASDGVHTAAELGAKAARNGLDFLAITDHNQFVSGDALPQAPGPTFIPGVEWTHYQGHANFLGSERPYDQPFATNTPAEAQARFESARRRGALIVINHPFEEICPFRFDLDSLPFDCLEVWNGPMRESNFRALGLWSSLLASGKKVPVCGGSDYHRDTPFIFLGGPTTCVYAMSAGRSDILEALRQGHAYISFTPNGPGCELTAGRTAILGDSVPWASVRELNFHVWGLLQGDVVRVISLEGGEEGGSTFQAPEPGSLRNSYTMSAPGFVRLEVLRAFLPGLPPLPALISNPIYFDK